MGKEYFKRPVHAPTVDSYSSNIESTGGIRAYSGNITASAGNFVASAGGVSVTGGGYTHQVLTAATGTTLVSYGFHKIGSTAAKTYTLAAPSAGRDVIIAAVSGASSGVNMTVLLAAGAHIGSSASTVTTLRKITFADGDDCIHLMGVTTAKYAVIGSYGSPTVAAT